MRKYLGAFLLFLVAVIFGFSYIFQAKAAMYVKPFTVGAIRYLLAAICMFPFVFKKDNKNINITIKFGIIIGFLIFIATACQQAAANHVSSGKVGFITSLYIVEVPIFVYIFYKKRINNLVKLAILLASIGLILLCNVKDFGFSFYDLLLLVASTSFAIEIIFVEKYVNEVSITKFCFVEFISAFVFSGIFALIFEPINIDSYKPATLPLIYIGVVVIALGYFLQNKGQSMVDGTTASLIMSFESVISALAGYIVLNEVLSIKEIFGCILLFISIIICVISDKEK